MGYESTFVKSSFHAQLMKSFEGVRILICFIDLSLFDQLDHLFPLVDKVQKALFLRHKLLFDLLLPRLFLSLEHLSINWIFGCLLLVDLVLNKERTVQVIVSPDGDPVDEIRHFLQLFSVFSFKEYVNGTSPDNLPGIQDELFHLIEDLRIDL